MSTRNIYCIDTSSIIEAWTRAYPRDHFPSVWERIERLIVDGRLRAPREVLDELERQEDGAHQWAKAQSGLVVPLNPEHAAEVQRIQEDFPYYNTEVGFSAGDPWVIALAKLYKYIVVTYLIKNLGAGYTEATE